MRRCVMVFILLIIASGCGRVKTTVSSFHTMPQALHEKHFYIFPCEENSSYLECSSYLNIIKLQLQQKGMIEGEIVSSDYYFNIYYDINGRTVRSTEPVYGQTGVSSAKTVGTINTIGNFGTYTGTTVYTPQYGIVGSQEILKTSFVRKLNVDVYVLNKTEEYEFKKVYEGKAVSEGSTDNLASVMPPIIESLFEEFPGESGTTKTYTKIVK